MKARNNKTGEIIDIEDMSIVTYKSSDGTYVKTLIKNFTFLDAEKDYYTKLEHQAAIAAMQGILSNYDLLKFLCKNGETIKDTAINSTIIVAYSLVEQLKENEKTMH